MSEAQELIAALSEVVERVAQPMVEAAKAANISPREVSPTTWDVVVRARHRIRKWRAIVHDTEAAEAQVPESA